MINLANVVLLTLIVLFVTKMLKPLNLNSSRTWALGVSVAAILIGVFVDYGMAIMLLTLYIVNAKDGVETYELSTPLPLKHMFTAVEEEEESGLPVDSIIESTIGNAESIGEEIEELPLETPTVSAPVEPTAPASVPVPASPEKECVPEFVISQQMLHNAQNNIFNEENMRMFPNETADKNINIQGVFDEITGYAGGAIF